MKKHLLSLLSVFVIFTTTVFSQNTQTNSTTDYWGTFCLVSNTVNDTNYFKVDLSQFTNEFEKVYFKNYFLEQDVFSSRIKSYNIIENNAYIAVPQKYTVEDFRHFIANMKKMTNTANYNWNTVQKNDYLLNNKDK